MTGMYADEAIVEMDKLAKEWRWELRRKAFDIAGRRGPDSVMNDEDVQKAAGQMAGGCEQVAALRWNLRKQEDALAALRAERDRGVDIPIPPERDTTWDIEGQRSDLAFNVVCGLLVLGLGLLLWWIELRWL